MKVTPLCILHSSFKSTNEVLSVLSRRLACGFPSPADDYAESIPSLNELLIKHPSATILAKAQGDSMIERGILDGSLLIIDRSIQPENDSTIVASIAGELTVKILDLKKQMLRPANPKHQPIPLPQDIDVICEGVVTYCISPQKNFAFTC
ncbi:LexA family protein [Alkalimarinus alittae]|uniref:Translesion error-prone DNA polymerase V autoproteolytic subunit n=1 Tax=Alkalimarinus alittae TaxID=2961619 RepID=A0ABY6N5Y0_9ALTE|nr:translesion error-prone DNA polymerase V autoproteolytic subunit [Alkalimarinus alittae]UZE97501.1 translesion error-prone DNA polymerase V autoproteolytic subunit [Alkalimarinus alittae]